MKNLKHLLYVLTFLIALSCEKDDAPEPPMETTKVTSVLLSTVDSFTGKCSKQFDFTGEIKTNGAMTVKYTWLRSDGATSPEKTLEFDAAGSKTVTTSWTLGADGNTYEGLWQQIKITTPEEILSNKAEFDLICDAEVVGIETSVAVIGENEFTGECPKKFEFEGTIEVDAPTSITYTWLRSDGATAPEETLEFEAAGTQTVTTSWTLGGGGTTYEGLWQQLKIIAPTEVLSNQASFDLTCLEDHTIDVLSLDPTSPSTLFIGDRVNFSFDYKTNEDDGVRIFGRPFTNGGLSPDYAAHGSPLHPVGSGNKSGFFTVNTPGKIDQIRFQMFNEDQTELLLELFVDVDYEFIAHSVTVNSITPDAPETLCLGERVEFSFDYITNEAGGVRIFGRPLTGGNPSPGYGAHGSPLYPTGEGSSTGFFTLNTAGTVDQIRFRMYNDAQTELLHEFTVDVDYTFVAHKVDLVTISPESPASLSTGERVEFDFKYKTTEASGVRIFGRPFTGGSPSPGYGAHPSPIHPTGEGTASGFFTLNGPGAVDQIRFQMWNADQSTLLYQYFVDVDYTFTN